MTFRQPRTLYFYALKGPAHYASQNPVHDANNQNRLLLHVRKISQENVHQGDRSAHDSQTKPPDDPVVNPNMDVIHGHRPLIY